MTDTGDADPVNGNAQTANSSPVLTGDEMLEFGVGAADGKVIVRFNKLIQWFDMSPELAVDFAESLISQATAAKLEAQSRKKLIVVDPLKLVKVRR